MQSAENEGAKLWLGILTELKSPLIPDCQIASNYDPVFALNFDPSVGHIMAQLTLCLPTYPVVDLQRAQIGL